MILVQTPLRIIVKRDLLRAFCSHLLFLGGRWVSLPPFSKKKEGRLTSLPFWKMLPTPKYLFEECVKLGVPNLPTNKKGGKNLDGLLRYFFNFTPRDSCRERHWWWLLNGFFTASKRNPVYDQMCVIFAVDRSVVLKDLMRTLRFAIKDGFKPRK